MNKTVEAQYNMLERRFIKEYGSVHLCGNCTHTFECKRMRIQNIRNIQRQKNLMAKLPFVKSFKVEPLLETQVPYGHGINFVSVFDCERFEFDKGVN
jgi:hypothetical protein